MGGSPLKSQPIFSGRKRMGRVLVTLDLIRNPKAVCSGVGVLAPSPDGLSLDWVRAVKDQGGGVRVYELEVGGLYVEVSDQSSHKNARKVWELFRALADGIQYLPYSLERVNRFWEGEWEGKNVGYSRAASIAARYFGKKVSDLNAIAVTNGFFLAAMAEVKGTQDSVDSAPGAPVVPSLPEGWEWAGEIGGVRFISRQGVPERLFLDALGGSTDRLGRGWAAFLREQAARLEALAAAYRVLAQAVPGQEGGDR